MVEIKLFHIKERRLLKCIKEAPQNLEPYLKLGKLYFLNADYAKAADIYQQGLKISPDNISLLFNCAVTEEARNRTENAKELYLKILSLDSNHKPAQERLAKITTF